MDIEIKNDLKKTKDIVNVLIKELAAGNQLSKYAIADNLVEIRTLLDDVETNADRLISVNKMTLDYLKST